MYPDENLRFLTRQSCSNFYKLVHDLKNHPCCLALGAGASATVGLPTWSHLLKRICHCYFKQWALKISSGKASAIYPPSEVSIALTNSYDSYIYEKEHPEVQISDEVFFNVEYFINGRKLSDEETRKQNEKFKKSHELIRQLQDDFMEKIMAGDLTVIAQMVKNQVRPSDWNYLIRKSIYASYEDDPYILRISSLYRELIELVRNKGISTIINYNFDDTFYHALKEHGLRYKNCYENAPITGKERIYYPHGYIPMKGGVTTDIVICEDDYQNHIYQQNLWANSIQTVTLSSHSCIFVGLSLNDSNIRRIINMCSHARRYMHYAFLPSSDENQASMMCDGLCDSDLYRLGIRVIRYPSENNHRKLTGLIHQLGDIS